MAENITEFISVRQRALDLGCAAPEGIAILPTNFETAQARSDFLHPSEAATVKTLFRNNHIPLTELLPASERPRYIQNNSIEWIAPTLYLSATLLAENQAIVSVALNVLSNYISDFLKGMSGVKIVKLNIVVEQKGKSYCRKVSYEGDVSGLVNVAKIIKQISDE